MKMFFLLNVCAHTYIKMAEITIHLLNNTTYKINHPNPTRNNIICDNSNHFKYLELLTSAIDNNQIKFVEIYDNDCSLDYFVVPQNFIISGERITLYQIAEKYFNNGVGCIIN